jgi:hypothetical protein
LRIDISRVPDYRADAGSAPPRRFDPDQTAIRRVVTAINDILFENGAERSWNMPPLHIAQAGRCA